MPDQPWVDGATFSQVLAATAARHGDRDAVVFPQLGYRRTYAQFQAGVRAVARSLLALGVQRGEHIGIWLNDRQGRFSKSRPGLLASSLPSDLAFLTADQRLMPQHPIKSQKTPTYPFLFKPSQNRRAAQSRASTAQRFP